jgi:hypothetical protein
MRHLLLFTVAAALVLTGMGAWAAWTTRGRVEPPMHVGVDPMQIMCESKNLPSGPSTFSLVFE